VTKSFAQCLLRMLLPALLIVSGCESCQQTPELPAPVPQEGRLPRAPQLPPTASRTPYIPPPSCAVVASASVEAGAAPLDVRFTAEGLCTDAEGTFTWDFGDGSAPVHEQNPSHIYQNPGTYTVRVTLADPEHNAEDTDEVEVNVTGR